LLSSHFQSPFSVTPTAFSLGEDLAFGTPVRRTRVLSQCEVQAPIATIAASRRPAGLSSFRSHSTRGRSPLPFALRLLLRLPQPTPTFHAPTFSRQPMDAS
jgi:hypothetical protein